MSRHRPAVHEPLGLRRRSRLVAVIAGALITPGSLTLAAPAGAAVSGAPGAPTAVSAHAAVNAAKVYWQPPTAEGDSPITGYTATASPGGQTCSAGATARSCVVSGLSNGATYTFTVTAANTTGTSDPSNPSNAVTPAVDTQDPVLVSSSVTPARVSSLGGTVTVELRITDDLSGVRTPSGGYDANPAIIFNRTDNTGSGVGFTRAVSRISGDEYDGIYRATVTIPSGTSPGSWDLTVYPIDDKAGNSTFFTDRPGIMVGTPAAPTNVTASAGADRAVTVTWDAPSDDGGNVITGYRVTGTGGQSFTTTGTSLTTAAYADRPATDPVSFTVTALNAAGSSPASTPSTPLTIPATPPSAPNLTDVTRGNKSLTGTWTAPTSTGGDTNVSYTLTATPGNASCTTSGLSCAIGDLTNGQPYTLSVTASNGAGSSPASNTASGTPATVPTVPTDLVASVGTGGTLYANWHPPAQDGGAAVDSYTATARSSAGTVGGTCTVVGYQCAFFRLDDGLWTVDVVATNEVGSSPAASPTPPVRIDTTAPSVAWSAQPPWAPVLTGQAAFTWSATDPSGIDSYRVMQRVAAPGKTFGSWTTTTQTTTGTTVPTPAGNTVCVRVAAVDNAGNAGAYSSPVCRTAPVDDRSGTTMGKVKKVSGSGYYAGTGTQLRAQGAGVKFTGVRTSTAQLVATTCATCGKVQVLYGSKVVKTLSLRSAKTVNQKVITLPAPGGTTSITFRSADGKQVVIDGLVLRSKA